jgi:hypothetical protein
MPHLEEITYDIGRAALADQESLVSGIRSRTGTLVAANRAVIRRLTKLSAALSVVALVQIVLWICAVAVR